MPYRLKTINPHPRFHDDLLLDIPGYFLHVSPFSKRRNSPVRAPLLLHPPPPIIRPIQPEEVAHAASRAGMMNIQPPSTTTNPPRRRPRLQVRRTPRSPPLAIHRRTVPVRWARVHPGSNAQGSRRQGWACSSPCRRWQVLALGAVHLAKALRLFGHLGLAPAALLVLLLKHLLDALLLGLVALLALSLFALDYGFEPAGLCV